MSQATIHCEGGPLDGLVKTGEFIGNRLIWPEADQHDGQYILTLRTSAGPTAPQGLTYTWRTHQPCPFKVGDRIIEKQHNSDVRRVIEIKPGRHIVCQGFRRTKIAWRNLKRYRLA
jgi:hypothetical protein